MKRTGRFLLIIIGCLMCLSGNCLFASIRVDVSSDVIGVGESVIIQISAEGASSARPMDLPQLEDAEIVFSGTMRSFQSVNGRNSSSIVLQYTVRVRKEGVIHIPPIRIEVDGTEEQTEPISITAEKRAAPAQQGRRFNNPLLDELFMEDEEAEPYFLTEKSLSASAVYVGQPLVSRYYLLCNKPVSISDSQWANVEQRTNFIVQPALERIPQLTVSREGDDFSRVHSGTWVLLPLKSGNYKIENEIMQFAYIDRSSMFRMPREQKLYFEQSNLIVLPLPQGAPLDFDGAVGDFKVSLTPSSLITEVEKPVIAEISVSGQGNFYSLVSPEFSPVKDVQFMPLEKKDSFRVSGNSLSGRVVFRWQLVPLREGDILIDGVTLSFFDPVKKQYRSESSQRLNLSVSAQTNITENDANAGDETVSLKSFVLPGLGIISIFVVFGVLFFFLVRRDRIIADVAGTSDFAKMKSAIGKELISDNKETDHGFLCDMYIRKIRTAAASKEEKPLVSAIEKALKYLIKEQTFSAEIAAKLDSIQDYLNRSRYGGVTTSDEVLAEIKSYIIAALLRVKRS